MTDYEEAKALGTVTMEPQAQYAPEPSPTRVTVTIEQWDRSDGTKADPLVIVYDLAQEEARLESLQNNIDNLIVEKAKQQILVDDLKTALGLMAAPE